MRNRAASPPVQARWSKVSEIGMRRCTSMPPITASTSWESLPAPTIATHGGVEVHRRMPISLTFDHRACTGGEAARFLKALLDDLSAAD